MMPKQLAFYFDQQHCSGCYTCQIACKDKNDLEAGANYRKVFETVGGGFIREGNVIKQDIYAFWTTISCNHCLEPICVKKCPTGALKKQLSDGIVVVDKEYCIGCKACLNSCPYEAIIYDNSTKKVSKCDFCVDLVKDGKTPVCVSSCPMRVLDYGELEELKEKYEGVREIQGLPVASITKPALIINPHKKAGKAGKEAKENE